MVGSGTTGCIMTLFVPLPLESDIHILCDARPFLIYIRGCNHKMTGDRSPLRVVPAPYYSWSTLGLLCHFQSLSFHFDSVSMKCGQWKSAKSIQGLAKTDEILNQEHKVPRYLAS